MANTKTFFEAYCPDPFCKERLIFDDNLPDVSTDCAFCGRTFLRNKLSNFSPTNRSEAEILKQRISLFPKRRHSSWIRAYGLSANYCKLISFMFTRYEVKKVAIENSIDQLELEELDDGLTLDCSIFAEFAFEIKEHDLLTQGYGRDGYGSFEYLTKTLSQIRVQNDYSDCLEPLCVAKSKYCVYFAVSRALVGREIYWHALFTDSRKCLIEKQENFRSVLSNYFTDNEWQAFVDDGLQDGDTFSKFCLANLFVLSNVLHRPIVLLDAIDQLSQSKPIQQATFLPTMISVDECRDTEGYLHSPIVVAWANKEHFSLVPLVTVEGRPNAKLHRSMLPKPFCTDDSAIEKFIEFEDSLCLVSEGYSIAPCHLNDLAKCVNELYEKEISVHPEILCDYIEDIKQTSNFDSIEFNECVVNLVNNCEDATLYRCVICWRLSLSHEKFEHNSALKPGGLLYEKMYRRHLKDGQLCTLPNVGVFRYDIQSIRFIPVVDDGSCYKCKLLKDQMRVQTANGIIGLRNGDHTRTPAPSAKCKRKMKHFYDGCEYDNPPLILSFEIDYNEKSMPIEVKYCWSPEELNERNSLVEMIASKVLSERFPDEDDNEKLTERIKEQISEKLDGKDVNELCQCKDPVWQLIETAETSGDADVDDRDDDATTGSSLKMEEFTIDTVSASTIVSNASPQKNAFLNVNCFRDDKTKDTVVFPSWETMTYAGLIESVCNTAGFHRNEIDRITYDDPPKLLRQNESPFPIDMDTKNVTVFLKKEPKNGAMFSSKQVESKKPEIQKRRSKETISRYLVAMLGFLREKFAKTNRYWTHLMKSSKLFSNKGVVYRLIVEKYGKKDRAHYALPGLLPNQNLVYSLEKDSFQICIPKEGHFDIDENLKQKLADASKFNAVPRVPATLHNKEPATKIVETASCTN